MATPKKMVNLAIDETSGVDHPAHLNEGWLVMKSADAATVTDIIDTLTNPTPQEDTLSDAKGTDERLAEALDDLAKAEDGATPPSAEPSEPVQEPAVEKAAEPTDADAFLKSAPESVIKMIEGLKAKSADAEEALRKERDERADREAVAKARTDYSSLAVDPELLGPALRRLSLIDGDLSKAVEQSLRAANGQMESANLFAELGKAQSGTAGSAWEKIEALADAAVASGVAKSKTAAIAKAVADHPDLYTDYLNEKGA